MLAACRGAEMRRATRAGKGDLPLPFRQALAPRCIHTVMAVMATDPRRVILMFKVFRCQRHAAGMAHGVLPRI